MKYDVSDPNSFYKIPKEPAVLDFTGCPTLGQLHQVLRKHLGLPDYYGENWDALWDCLLYFRDYPITIEVYGIGALPQNLDSEVDTMLRIFERVNGESVNVKFVVVE